MRRVLLLPGLMGTGDLKRQALLSAGFDVTIVAFDDSGTEEWPEVFKSPLRNSVRLISKLLKARKIYATWVKAAQAAYDSLQPDVVVGSSRGGSVALTMRVDRNVPIVLLAPAYKWFRWIGGRTSTKHPNVTVIHSRQDDRIPFAESEQLCRRCPQVKLIEAGSDHSLNTPDATTVWIQEVERLAKDARKAVTD